MITVDNIISFLTTGTPLGLIRTLGVFPASTKNSVETCSSINRSWTITAEISTGYLLTCKNYWKIATCNISDTTETIPSPSPLQEKQSYFYPIG